MLLELLFVWKEHSEFCFSEQSISGLIHPTLWSWLVEVDCGVLFSQHMIQPLGVAWNYFFPPEKEKLCEVVHRYKCSFVPSSKTNTFISMSTRESSWVLIDKRQYSSSPGCATSRCANSNWNINIAHRKKGLYKINNTKLRIGGRYTRKINRRRATIRIEFSEKHKEILPV